MNGPIQWDDFVRMETERLDALVAGDLAALEELLSDELHYGHSSGFAEGKASYIEAVRAGRYVYLAGAIKVERIVGLGAEAVLVAGQLSLDVVMNGAPQLMRSIYMAVWQREGERWRFVGHQSTRKPAE